MVIILIAKAVKTSPQDVLVMDVIVENADLRQTDKSVRNVKKTQ